MDRAEFKPTLFFLFLPRPYVSLLELLHFFFEMKFFAVSGFLMSMFFARNLSLLPHFSTVSSANPFFFKLRTTAKVSSKSGWVSAEVDRAGFEPAASALRTRRSYQTDLPAHFDLTVKKYLSKRF